MSNPADWIEPQFALPFEFTMDTTGGDVRYVEQGDEVEIQQCVFAVLAYEIGQFTADPSFGSPQDLFAVGGIDLDALQAAVLEWEPRAAELFAADDTWLSTAAQSIAAILGVGSTSA